MAQVRIASAWVAADFGTLPIIFSAMAGLNVPKPNPQIAQAMANVRAVLTKFNITKARARKPRAKTRETELVTTKKNQD